MNTTIATLHRVLEDRPLLVRAAALPTAHLERYLALALHAVRAEDVSLACSVEGFAAEVLSPGVFGVAAMLGATTGYDERSGRLETLARDRYAANAARDGRHAYAWGALADATPRIVDAWRHLIATRQLVEYHGIPPDEAALLLRRKQ